MAKKRCISIDFYDSEEFCELTPRAKHLYTELILHCDDDGVVINPKAVLRICKTDQKYLDLLENKKFLIRIDEVYIIRHWHIHNHIQPSKKVDSIYGEALSQVVINPKNEYELISDFVPEKIRPNLNKVNLSKSNSSKVNISERVEGEISSDEKAPCDDDFETRARGIFEKMGYDYDEL